MVNHCFGPCNLASFNCPYSYWTLSTLSLAFCHLHGKKKAQQREGLVLQKAMTNNWPIKTPPNTKFAANNKVCIAYEGQYITLSLDYH